MPCSLLGGAALQRCDNGIVLIRALDAEVRPLPTEYYFISLFGR